ncbi:uroporphyrinogen-III C-methyltransferase [Nodosilinea sp. P-1105]|uniref:uroporphyrinogen-III C-methyltransferase n=1 Tax=Nodosilinea sp. P-1105 TaxID=2546229 RepID=UPI00146C7257|nr:uroporphyrinogen-III C-methyltransferase [Nodosilinea sp. P-1105]NMF82964.1 uroporphyrinogen-III C-methyltransferase [Nodosilinea sp. P-1105]
MTGAEQQMGRVYIVGAGPGRLDYLTLRGYGLLQQAQCLVHDALVDPNVLTLLSPHCETIDVGKRGGRPSPAQGDIDQLLVNLCRQGRQVVRLKSGDPFIFGRTASEVQALKAAHCPFEVVPGVSSALAAPLLAGIPLTDPVWSHGFGVVTAHNPDLLDWPSLARLHTLVILMGSRHLEEIVRRLQHNGCRGDMPVAIIRWGGHDQQQVWEGTLLSIRQVVKGQSLSPCVMVFGEVVRLRPYLMPDLPTLPSLEGGHTGTAPTVAFPPPSPHPPIPPSPEGGHTGTVPTAPPLTGKTILITRSAGQSSSFTDLLTARGARVVEMPALEIRPPSSWDSVDRAIAALSSFQWLIITSANAVNFFLQRLWDQGHDLRALGGLKIAVVGQKTAAVLQQWRLSPDFIPPDFVADSLVETFPESVAGQRILFPRVESGGREVLVQSFSVAGAEVVEVAAYESGCPLRPEASAIDALRDRQVDVITFASSKTVGHTSQLLEQGLGPNWRQWLAGVAVASIGPKTSHTCREQLGRVDIEPATYTLDALTEAIAAWASGSSD